MAEGQQHLTDYLNSLTPEALADFERAAEADSEVGAATRTVLRALEAVMKTKHQGVGSPAEVIPDTPENRKSFLKIVQKAHDKFPFNRELNAIADRTVCKKESLISIIANLYHEKGAAQLVLSNIIPKNKIPDFTNSSEFFKKVWDECALQDAAQKKGTAPEKARYSGETFKELLNSDQISGFYRSRGFQGTSKNLKKFIDDVKAGEPPQEIPAGLLTFLAEAFDRPDHVKDDIGLALPGRRITVQNFSDPEDMWQDIWNQCRNQDEIISGSGKTPAPLPSSTGSEKITPKPDPRVEQLQARVHELEDALERTKKERDSFARQVDVVTRELTEDIGKLVREREVLKRDEIALKELNERMKRESDARIRKVFESPAPTEQSRQAPASSAEVEPATDDVGTLNRWLASGSNRINEILDTLANNFGTRDSVVHLAKKADLSPSQVSDNHNPKIIWTSLFTRLNYSEEGSFRKIVSEAVRTLSLKKSKSVLGKWADGDRKKLSSYPLKKELAEALSQLADNSTSIRKVLGDAGLGKFVSRLNLSGTAESTWSYFCDYIGKGLLSDTEFAGLIREVKNLTE